MNLLITVAIPFVLRSAARDIWHRLMDAVDPDIVDRLEGAARVYGVEEMNDSRVRWLGHRLEAELAIVVDADLRPIRATQSGRPYAMRCSMLSRCSPPSQSTSTHAVITAATNTPRQRTTYDGRHGAVLDRSILERSSPRLDQHPSAPAAAFFARSTTSAEPEQEPEDTDAALLRRTR